jgi:hypothetical protein
VNIQLHRERRGEEREGEREKRRERERSFRKRIILIVNRRIFYKILKTVLYKS